jgi:hypothetical protein
VKVLTDLLGVRSLERIVYERCVRFFVFGGLALVAIGVLLAVFGDIIGFGSTALKG